MKKFLLTITILLISVSNSWANYEKYYEFSDNLDVKFIPTNEKLDKQSKKEYTKILKNEKFINKKKYDKAEKYYPDYIPNIARFISVYTDKKDFIKALEYAKRLSELDKKNLFPTAAKEYRIGILYSMTGDYINSNKYLIPYINNNSWARLQIAQNYYYMQDLKTAETYATKISSNSGAFFPAQELLYSIYKITKNPPKAYQAAKNLIICDPGNPENYIKIASVTTNPEEKLINYKRAKQLYYTQNLTNMISQINNLIAPIEQNKIDNAYKTINSYCKKPDWFKIKSKNAHLFKNDIAYWDNRQNDFFETANDCIKRYKGNNLAACFKDINETQEKLDIELATENARILEAKQREVQINQLIKQNMLLEEQNMLRWSRFNYYPRYYVRFPYWW